MSGMCCITLLTTLAQPIINIFRDNDDDDPISATHLMIDDWNDNENTMGAADRCTRRPIVRTSYSRFLFALVKRAFI